MKSMVRLVTLAVVCIAVFVGTPFAQAQTMYVVNSGTGELAQVSAGGAVSTFATGFSNPWGLAADPVGNLYVGSIADKMVYKVDSSGTVTVYASGFAGAANLLGMAFDAGGNLYVADVSVGVYKVTPGGGSVSLWATGMSYPRDVAFTTAGDLYAAGGYNPMSLYSVSSGGTPTLFASVASMSGFSALDIDSAGNFAVSGSNGTIYKVTLGGSVSTFLTGYTADGLAFDDAGNLYIANSNGTIYRATPGGVVTPFATGFPSPRGMVFAAVPEPSAIAAVLGAIALFMVVLRRRGR